MTLPISYVSLKLDTELSISHFPNTSDGNKSDDCMIRLCEPVYNSQAVLVKEIVCKRSKSLALLDLFKGVDTSVLASTVF